MQVDSDSRFIAAARFTAGHNSLAREHTSNAYRRRSRAKPLENWELLQVKTAGRFALSIENIARKCPSLTRTELRIAALVRDCLCSREIGELLGISERSVENYRSKLRKKLELPQAASLQAHLHCMF
jgi:DNA-binding CsgD family transcriptional regulator